MADELTGFSGRRRRNRRERAPEETPSPSDRPADEKPAQPKAAKKTATKTSDHEILSRPIAPFLTLDTIRKIKTAIDAAQNAGDYRYKNVPGVVREAIFAFMDDRLRLAPKPKPGPKKRVHILMRPSDHDRYEAKFSDFDRKRSEVIERAAAAFLLNGFSGDK